MSPGTDVAHRTRWPYVSLTPLGLGAWAPIYAGLKCRRRCWVIWGIVWTLLTLVGWALSIAQNGQGSIGGLPLILGWVGGAATSFSIRSSYEQAMASPLLQAQTASEQRLRERQEALQIARSRPQLAVSEKVHGFTSLEDMGVALDLDGHLVEGLRGQVVFLPRA